MAQNLFINVVVDPSAASKVESAHQHSATGSNASAGSLTVSLDTTVVTSLFLYDSIMKAVRLRMIGGGLK